MIFKTSGGKYVAPQPIENKMKESPFIELKKGRSSSLKDKYLV